MDDAGGSRVVLFITVSSATGELAHCTCRLAHGTSAVGTVISLHTRVVRKRTSGFSLYVKIPKHCARHFRASIVTFENMFSDAKLLGSGKSSLKKYLQPFQAM
jgi:hypothetical protein